MGCVYFPYHSTNPVLSLASPQPWPSPKFTSCVWKFHVVPQCQVSWNSCSNISWGQPHSWQENQYKQWGILGADGKDLQSWVSSVEEIGAEGWCFHIHIAMAVRAEQKEVWRCHYLAEWWHWLVVRFSLQQNTDRYIQTHKLRSHCTSLSLFLWFHSESNVASFYLP